MKGSILYPPNFQQLGDTVIRDVAQGSRHNSIFDEDTRSRSTRSSESNLDGSRRFTRLPPSIRAPERFGSSALFSSTPPMNSEASSSGSMTRQLRPKTTDVQDRSLMLRRARGRVYQERHRVKKRRSEIELQTNIKALQEQIHQLETDKLIISLGLAMNTTPWSVASEYFRLVRHGAVDEEKPIATTSASCNAQVQQHFLRSTMSPDLSDGTMHGLEAVIESWKYMSRCFGNIDMVPLRLENGPEDVIVANCKCRFTITENTLRLAFPHLLQDQMGSKFSHLAPNLVGQILVIRGAMYLRWDAEIGRMFSLTWQVDLVKPLLELLGSIEEVSRVFDHALVTPDCRQAVVEE